MCYDLHSILSCWAGLQTYWERMQNMYLFWKFHYFDFVNIRPFIIAQL